jgi:MSHA pilin protein MshD
MARQSIDAARGLSLIELIVFIVIVSVGIAGILGVMNLTTKASADPLIQKQALAIAEAYLEEVLAMPFTYCDPDDANAATAESTGAVNPADPTRCATNLETNLVPENMGGLETRGNTTIPLDNVNDYNGLSGVPASLDGTAIGGLEAYQVSVVVVAEALSTVTAAESLRVTVTVTGPADTTVRLDGYRTRYAPNALP